MNISIAQRDSRCGVCDEAIYAGDRIALVGGEWCHAECTEEPDAS